MSEQLLIHDGKILKFNEDRLVWTTAAGPSYPTDGLQDLWFFEDSLVGVNGTTITNNGMSYDYITSGLNSGKGLRQTNAPTVGKNMNIADSFFSTFGNASQAATFNAWIYTPSNASPAWTAYFGKGTTHTDPAVALFHFTWNNPYNNWSFGRFGQANNTSGNWTGDAWHMFTLTWDGTTWTAYLDNVLRGTGTNGAPTNTSTPWVVFGVWQNETAFQYSAISQLGAWNKVLDSTERDQLWNGGSGI